MAKTYKQIVKSKKLKELFYQVTFFAKKVWMNSVKPLVLAAGTSAGKTFTTIIQLEIFYSIPQNAKKITLIFAASKTVLRDNFLNALEEFNPSFSYYVVTNKKELEEAIRDGYQVIVCLPQTLQNNYTMMPKVTNFILDEAHQWYFKPTIQKILKHIKPTRQLLLTGTPSRFIAKGDGFEFFFVPVMDLYENSLVSNVRFEVVSSTYDFKYTDWNVNSGVLKNNKTNSPKKTIEALKAVCDEMILKLRSKLGNKYLSNVRGANKIASMFNDLDKTIIFCHSVKQANSIYKELSEMKGLKDKVLISHSENDTDSEMFEEFRTKDEYVVLVAVDRGRLGYNLPDLFNVVDFTMTQSLDMILQMMGRLLRLSKKKTEKIYYKVATKNTSAYFVDLMTAALCLFKMEWYSKFNGKNMGGIQIPKVLTSKSKPKGKQSSSSSSQKKSTTQQLLSLEELGIPMDLNLFNQSILYSQGDKFSTVAWTTLDDARREFFQIRKGNTYWKYDEIKEEALKFNTIIDFIKFDKEHYNMYQFAYKKGWKEIFNHCENRNKEITKKEIIESANNYDDYTLWGKECPNIRAKAVKLGIAHDVSKHMKKNIKWSKKMIIDEAKKYNTKVDFKNNSAAYGAARRFGILDLVTKHMKRPRPANARKVIQKDLNGNIVKVWDSLMDAQSEYNSSIQKCIYKKQKSALGYIWEYQK